ncbi:unnamed protein product, partial [marine sediment metagenome]
GGRLRREDIRPGPAHPQAARAARIATLRQRETGGLGAPGA